jgi:hypothetical protein
MLPPKLHQSSQSQCISRLHTYAATPEVNRVGLQMRQHHIFRLAVVCVFPFFVFASIGARLLLLPKVEIQKHKRQIL